MRSYILPITVALTFLFLYVPIFILIVFSFNSVAFPYRWVSFSWRWYYELLQSPEIWQAFKNSLIVASVSVVSSLIMGMLLVFYSAHSKLKNCIILFYGGILMPEIIMAVGLLSFLTWCSVPLGLVTLIVGHTLLGLSYVVPILFSRFSEFDPSLIEASLDLGATIHQTFIRVILPIMTPALVASALLVFIISFDDFLISFFCAGPSAQTLSLYIFAMIRTGISPTINALSTLLLILSSLLVLIFCSIKTKVRIF